MSRNGAAISYRRNIMFRITEGKGFHMAFENGFTVSVQFGFGNYCENRHEPIDAPSGECADAELAVIGGDGNVILNTVTGHLSTDKAAKIIGLVKAASTKDDVIYGIDRIVYGG